MAKWYIDKAGTVSGPVRSSALRKLAATGELLPEHLVRKDETGRWCRAASVQGLFPSRAPADTGPNFGFLESANDEPGGEGGMFDFSKLTDPAPRDVSHPTPPPKERPPAHRPGEDDERVPLNQAADPTENAGPGTDRIKLDDIEFRTVSTIKVDDGDVPRAIPTPSIHGVMPQSLTSGDTLTGIAATTGSHGVKPTGGMTTLAFMPHSLLARTVRSVGSVAEVFLPLGKIDSAVIIDGTLGDLPSKLLTVSAGRTQVTLAIAGDAEPARVFVLRLMQRIAGCQDS
jgi:hypothetical protein